MELGGWILTVTVSLQRVPVRKSRPRACSGRKSKPSLDGLHRIALVLELDPVLEPRAWAELTHKLTDSLSPCAVGVGDRCTWRCSGAQRR
jgi:hypothetical protein